MDAQDEAGAEGLLALGSDTLTTEIVASKGEKHWHGFFAYRALAARIPILWPLLPFLYLWPIATTACPLGQAALRRVEWAELESGELPLAIRSREDNHLQPSIIAVYVIGTLLLIVNILFGMKKITEGWPFACYPLFSGIAKPTFKALKMVPLSSTGEPISYNNEQKLVKKFSSARFVALSKHILKSQNDPQQLESRLKALWQWWIQNEPTLQQAVSVRFYEETLTVIPERKAENPLQQKLLFELNLREDA
jgi:hypothetical protein